MASIFTLKRVTRYQSNSGVIFHRVWVLSENGRDVLVDRSLKFITDSIAAVKRIGGAQ